MEQSKQITAMEPQAWERGVVTLAQAAEGRRPCLVWGRNKASFWVTTEVESPSCFELVLDSSFPYPYPEDYTAEKYPRLVPQHNIDCEIENIGLADFLDINPGYPHSNDEWLATWMMQEGLAPGQAFRIMANVNYVGHTSMDWIGTEWDSEVDWEIVEREYIEPEEAARRWQAYADDFKECRNEGA